MSFFIPHHELKQKVSQLINKIIYRLYIVKRHSVISLSVMFDKDVEQVLTSLKPKTNV